jgi:four helix bundle protein
MAPLPRHLRRCTAQYAGSVSRKLRLGEGMHIPVRKQVLEEALQLIAAVRPLVESVARRDRELASRLRRAASSVALNLAEAFGSAAGNARLRFECARGSLYEAQAALRVAVAWGYVSPESAEAALAVCDHLAGRIHGLARR